MAHHNSRDCTSRPCNPGPPAGHHREPIEYDEDDGTTGETRTTVEPPRREDDSPR